MGVVSGVEVLGAVPAQMAKASTDKVYFTKQNVKDDHNA